MRNANRRMRSWSNGFTLIEMMIVLVILAVVLGFAVPAFQQVRLATRLTSYANDLVGSLYLARGEAIKRNNQVRLCATSDGATCATSGGWQQGWIVLDPNDVVLQYQAALQAGYSLTETANGGALTLTFDASGLVSPAPATFTVCRQTPTVGDQKREISVTTIGRTNVERGAATTCP